MKNACTDAITNALGREPTEQELDDIASAVQDRLNRKLSEGLSARDAAKAVGAEMQQEAALRATLAKRDAYNNLLVYTNLKARNVAGSEARIERAVLSGD